MQQQYRSKCQQVQLQLLPLCVADAAAKQATRKKAQAKVAHNIKHTQLLLYTHTHTRAYSDSAQQQCKVGKIDEDDEEEEEEEERHKPVRGK